MVSPGVIKQARNLTRRSQAFFELLFHRQRLQQT